MTNKQFIKMSIAIVLFATFPLFAGHEDFASSILKLSLASEQRTRDAILITKNLSEAGKDNEAHVADNIYNAEVQFGMGLMAIQSEMELLFFVTKKEYLPKAQRILKADLNMFKGHNNLRVKLITQRLPQVNNPQLLLNANQLRKDLKQANALVKQHFPHLILK